MKFLNLFNKNFFETNIKYLQFTLLWPPEENGFKKIIYLASFGASFIGIMVTVMLSEIIQLLSNITSYVQTIRTLSCFTLHVIYLYKITKWFKNRRMANLCIEMLYRKSYNFTGFEQPSYNFKHAFGEMSYFVDERFKSANIVVHTENLEEFWTKNKLQSNQNENENCKKEVQLMKDIQEEITTETNIHSCLVIIIVYLLVIIAIGFIYCDCIYEIVLAIFYGKFTHLPRLPEEIYFPLNTTDINTYTFLCIYQCIVALYVSTQYIGIDFFFWSMLIHLDGQVRVVQKALLSLSTEDVPHICQMDVQFSKCMYELQQMIDLLDVLKVMYSIPLLLQYLFVIVVCCCVLYNMSQEDNVFMVIGLLGFAGCALADSFFNIFYITELTHQFAAVTDAIYSINWVGTNIRFQKKIIFALARMQKTIGIDMGGMIPVDLNVFIKIMQTTYSFFTLLQK